MENMKHAVWTWLLIAGLPLALVTGTASQSGERQNGAGTQQTACGDYPGPHVTVNLD